MFYSIGAVKLTYRLDERTTYRYFPS